MPLKPTTKAAYKVSKFKTNSPKAKKAKTTPKKQLTKAKALPKTAMSSPKPKETSPKCQGASLQWV
ncbi:hypothetical protein DSO57_1010489 [Entomophthora muscae]|uniref:Uncharacterized protein n=1 Tax=Entomophthora muscae TaxID=34485 RepID=A0ACC2SJW7_9FUNG|nr:hypothetical protein DSO57_1010489 [Entomophthora muscae]